MSITIDVQHRLGDFHLDARFESDGRLTALFGKSGSGKTSLVNVIAGLIKPDKGRVLVDGETLVDTDKGVFIPKHQRRIGYVFQEGRLFPHLSVRSNLLYGQWFAPKKTRRESLATVVDLLGIGDLLNRGPAALSGGEKQRVAIGRALLASPRILLMDEPLASLDESRKQEIMPYIERLRDETQVPIVYVSHALPEITRLAATVVVMANGTVTTSGSMEQVIGDLDLAPAAAADQASVVIEAEVLGHDAPSDITTLRCTAGALQTPRLDVALGTKVRLRVRARDVLLATKKPEGLSALNIFEGVVRDACSHETPAADLSIDCNGLLIPARITRKAFQTLNLAPGRPVYVILKAVTFDTYKLGSPVIRAASGDL